MIAIAETETLRFIHTLQCHNLQNNFLIIAKLLHEGPLVYKGNLKVM